jgi:hypothetical protein
MNLSFKSIAFVLFVSFMVLHVGCVAQQRADVAQAQPSHEEHHAICFKGATAVPQEASSTQEEEAYDWLNDYACCNDGFSTTIEVGKILLYENRGTPIESHFKILQVLSDNTALAIRHSNREYFNGELRVVYEEAIFFIHSASPYADGVRLRDGKYLCTGIRQYTALNGTVKTVYVLEEQK